MWGAGGGRSEEFTPVRGFVLPKEQQQRNTRHTKRSPSVFPVPLTVTAARPPANSTVLLFVLFSFIYLFPPSFFIYFF